MLIFIGFARTSTAASATPDTIRTCFNRLLDLERDLLRPYWGEIQHV